MESRGIVNADGNLTAKYDAATANWGGNWRMPTQTEMEELINKCKWEWASVNGVNGQLVTGPNGNSIFLPAAGLWDWSSIVYRGEGGDYWSATLISWSMQSSCYLWFGSSNYDWDRTDRCRGNTVRPVAE